MFPIKLIAGIKGVGLVVILLCLIKICMENDEPDYNGDVYDGPDPKPPIKKIIREKCAPAAVCAMLAVIEVTVDVAFMFFTS